MPSKGLSSSVDGAICSAFANQAVKSYTATLTPMFEQLTAPGGLTVPDGYKLRHSTGSGPGESLLGYGWETLKDIISTNKQASLNLYPPRRGRKPALADMRQASDLLRLHKLNKLRHRHALSAVHALFDPLGTCPWVAAINKFVYCLLVVNSHLATEPGAGYDTELTQDYVSNQLFYSVEATLEANTLRQPRSWRLPLCVTTMK